jgi:hypothetical protein
MDGFRRTKGSSQAIPQISVSRTYCLFSKLVEMKTCGRAGGVFHDRFGVKFKNLFSIKTTDTPFFTLQGLLVADSFRCPEVKLNLPSKSGPSHLSQFSDLALS